MTIDDTTNKLDASKKMPNNDDLTDLETQATQIAGLLNTHANDLSLRTIRQLEKAREQAVTLHSQQLNQHKKDGTFSHVLVWADHHRIATTGLLLIAIMAGFIWMQSNSAQHEHGDAFLLGAELPPEAFVDRSFEPSLNNVQAKL